MKARIDSSVLPVLRISRGILPSPASEVYSH